MNGCMFEVAAVSIAIRERTQQGANMNVISFRRSLIVLVTSLEVVENNHWQLQFHLPEHLGSALHTAQ